METVSNFTAPTPFAHGKTIPHLVMTLRLVNVDPSKSFQARVIYDYGQEQYFDGIITGFIYAGLGFVLLLCMKELYRSKIHQ